MDLSGMGPWEMSTARVSEAIGCSTAWATNELAGANAVVAVQDFAFAGQNPTSVRY